MKNICMWCGKSHKKLPSLCREKFKKMNEICQEVDQWQVMQILELYGASALDELIQELKHKADSKKHYPNS